MRGRGPAWHPADTGGAARARCWRSSRRIHQGVLTLFILAGRYVRRHAGDLPGQQPVSLDLGAGNRARSAARWRTRGPTPQEFLYVTDSLSRIWRYDGAVWAQVTTIGTRSLLWSTRDELWGADREFVTKCEGDPANPADWTLPVPCGDGIALVSGMADVASRMYFFTDDGAVWSLQADTTAIPLFRGLETTRDPRNGRNPTPWLNQLYFRSGDSFYRLSGTETATFDPIGPERLQTNTSPVRGPVGAFAGALGYYAFAGVYNPRCSAPDGYEGPCLVPAPVRQLGALGGGRGGRGAVPGRLRRGPGGVGGQGDHQPGVRRHPQRGGQRPGHRHPRLYAGFADGTYGWVTQPRNGPNPFDPDAGVEFTSGLSFLRWPRHCDGRPGRPEGVPLLRRLGAHPRPVPLGGRAVPRRRGGRGDALGAPGRAPCGRRPSG